jgi:hypothetical protein
MLARITAVLTAALLVGVLATGADRHDSRSSNARYIDGVSSRLRETSMKPAQSGSLNPHHLDSGDRLRPFEAH